MFNIESAIAKWREQMLRAGIQSPVPLEELESHLRDEIQERIISGMEPAAAFASAIAKIGQPAPLQTEFTKIEKPDHRQGTYLLALAVLCSIIPLYFFNLNKYKDELDWTWRVAGISNVLLLCAGIVGCRFVNNLFPVILNKRRRTAIGISVAACCMAGMIAFVNFVLPHISLNLGQLFVVVLWGLTLMTTGAVVVTGLEEAARKAIEKK